MSGLTRRARRHVRRAADASVRVTSPLKLQPGFLVVGAQRCGTTSMFKTLVQHPQVVRPFLRKGVHYFDKKYEEGPRWYRGHFPTAATARLRRLRAGPPITGESSPYYMFHPRAAERIASDLPGVRLIVLVRDPVERAYSAHAHEIARGYESEPFERAVFLEPQRLAGERERMLADDSYDSHSLQHHAYLARGRYHEQLTRLEALVGADRLHVVDSQDFFDDPAPVFAGVLDFLGLRPADGIVFEQHNARPRAPLAAGLREELEASFAPHDEALAAWWGRTPSWRR